jgi:hypothetical protein
MRDGSSKIQFVAHNTFTPRYDMPNNIAHILKATLKITWFTLEAAIARNYQCWTARSIIPCTLELFISKLLGGVKKIKQIRVFISFKHEIRLSNVYENIWIVTHREHVAYPLFRLMSFREITDVCSENYTKCKKKMCYVDKFWRF